jgi:sec-independent protein translocase protein TatB
MFGLSFGEILIIAVLALLLLGPDRLPDAAKTLGKGLRDLRKATDDLKDQVEREIYTDDSRKIARPALVPPVPASPPVPGPAGPPPPATPDNVPGLEAALAEPPGAEPAAPPSADADADAGVREPTAEDVAAAAVPLPTTPPVREGEKA